MALIYRVAVWKQLHLNNWFSNAYFSQALVEPVSEPLFSRVAVWKQLRLYHWLAGARHIILKKEPCC
jgi:hypothetical protein